MTLAEKTLPEKILKFLPKKISHPEKKYENVPEKASNCPGKKYRWARKIFRLRINLKKKAKTVFGIFFWFFLGRKFFSRPLLYFFFWGRLKFSRAHFVFFLGVTYFFLGQKFKIFLGQTFFFSGRFFSAGIEF